MWLTVVTFLLSFLHSGADVGIQGRAEVEKATNPPLHQDHEAVFAYLNKEKYPLHKSNEPATINLVKRCKEEMKTNGLCVLENFMQQGGIENFVDEINTIPGHDLQFDFRLHEERRCKFNVDFRSRKRIKNDGLLIHLYTWRPFVEFFQKIMGTDDIYLSEDAHDSVYVNVHRQNDTSGWHYDEHDFAAILLLTETEEGGIFQHKRIPKNSTAAMEEMIEKQTYNELRPPPGSVYFIDGGNLLHRVSEVISEMPRVTIVYCFAPTPHFYMVEQFAEEIQYSFGEIDAKTGKTVAARTLFPQWDLSDYNKTTTASEVLDGIDLKGKVVIVTGTSDGIGIETARSLMFAGATVIGAVRDLGKMEIVAKTLRQTNASGSLDVIKCDLSDLSSVRAFAAQFLEKYDSLDVLVLNAGIMATDGRRETAEGYELQFGVNHLGHFLLAGLLTPVMLKNPRGARLVSVASIAHKRTGMRFDDLMLKEGPYDKWLAYGQSKTANILFAREFNRRYAPHGIFGFSVNPGEVATSLDRECSETERSEFEAKEGKKFHRKSPKAGAATSVFAATSNQLRPGHGGSYLSDCNIVTKLFNGDFDEDFFGNSVAEHALSDEDASRLWEVSEKLVGHTFTSGRT